MMKLSIALEVCIGSMMLFLISCAPTAPPQVCSVGETKCESGKAYRCAPSGTTWNVSNCAADEECAGGECKKKSTQTHNCVPGTTQRCFCASGQTGAQSCLSDGSGYDTCSCVNQPTEACTSSTECKLPSICIDGKCVLDPDWSPGVQPENQKRFETLNEGGSGGVKAWGDVVGEFCGVKAYSNANPSGTACDYGNSRYDGVNRGTFGYEYQCVELALRFLCHAYDQQLNCKQSGKQNKRYGNAWEWFDNKQNHPVLSHSKIDRFASGTTPVKPQPGDLIVFGRSCIPGTGHIAVIRAVGEDYIQVMEQNYNCTSQDGSRNIRLHVNQGVYSVKCALGWMRVKNAASTCEHPKPKLLAPTDGKSFLAGQDISLSWLLGKSDKEHYIRIRNIDTQALFLDDHRIGMATNHTVTGIPVGMYQWVVFYRDPACEEGRCVSLVWKFQVTKKNCAPNHATKKCYQNRVYWYDQCGVRNDLAETCPSGSTCQNGACQATAPSCSAQTCSGCCSGTSCESGTSNQACGSGGNACQACTGGRTCQSGQCVCQAKHAKKCVGNDVYWFDSCGAQGAKATSCTSTEQCQGGVCVQLACSQTCNGCCRGGTCYAGGTSAACGVGGGACLTCSGGQLCQNGGCQCPSGTKDCGGSCQACCSHADCTGNQACQGGVCSGCQNGYKMCNGLCILSSQCCSSCSGGKICQGGSCQCPSGTKDCGGSCQSCCADADCGSGQACQGGTCVAKSPQVTGIQCTTYKKGSSTSCTLSGANFATGSAWVRCLSLSGSSRSSATRWQVTGTWHCNCATGSTIEANVTGGQKYTSTQTLQEGDATISKITNQSIYKGKNYRVYVDGCNLGDKVYIAGVRVSNIVLRTNGEQVYFDAFVPTNWTGTKGWRTMEISRVSGASCSSSAKACTSQGIYVH